MSIVHWKWLIWEQQDRCSYNGSVWRNGNGNNHSDCLYNDLTCFWCDESMSYHKLETHKSTVGLEVAISYFFFDLYRKEIECVQQYTNSIACV